MTPEQNQQKKNKIQKEAKVPGFGKSSNLKALLFFVLISVLTGVVLAAGGGVEKIPDATATADPSSTSPMSTLHFEKTAYQGVTRAFAPASQKTLGQRLRESGQTSGAQVFRKGARVVSAAQDSTTSRPLTIQSRSIKDLRRINNTAIGGGVGVKLDDRFVLFDRINNRRAKMPGGK